MASPAALQPGPFVTFDHLVALVALVTPAAGLTAGEPRASEIPDAPVLSLE